MKTKGYETIFVNMEIEKEAFDAKMAVILAQDMIKALRDALGSYGAPLREYARNTVTCGFPRDSVKHSVSMAGAKFMGSVDIAERNIDKAEAHDPAMVSILKADLESLRQSIEEIMGSTEELILATPDIEKQMINTKGGL
jgi:hypothetical protein